MNINKMKIILFLIACIAIVPEITNAKRIAEGLITIEGQLNICSGPGTNYSVIGIARKGDHFPVIGYREAWSQVQTPYGRGFVSNKFLLSLPTSQLIVLKDTNYWRHSYFTDNLIDNEVWTALISRCRVNIRL